MIAIWSGYYSCGVFFKPLLTEFGWSRTAVSGAFSLAMLVSGLLSVPLGSLTDRLGTRLVMTVCGFLMGAGLLLMSLVNSVWQIYLFYTVIIGIGMGGSFVPVVSAIVRWFTTRRGTMTGFVLAGSGVGALVGPPVANKLITVFDWRQAYLILGASVLVLSTVLAQLLRRDPAQMGQTPYGEKTVNRELPADSQGISLQEAMHTRPFWMLFLAQLSMAYSFFAFTVHIAARTNDLGFSAANAAMALAAFGAGSITGRIGLGAACDYLGNKRTYLYGAILNTLAVFLLVPAKELWAIYPLAVVMGITQGGTGSVVSPLQAELFGIKSHALILGVAGFGYTIGAAGGPILTGYLFDVTGNYDVAFLTSALITVTAIIFVLLIKPVGDMKKGLQSAG